MADFEMRDVVDRRKKLNHDRACEMAVPHAHSSEEYVAANAERLIRIVRAIYNAQRIADVTASRIHLENLLISGRQAERNRQRR